MKPHPLALLVAACTALGLAGCASDDTPRDAGGYSEPRRPPRPPPNVFISPAGQPFRAATGAPYPVATWFAAANTSHDGRLTREQFRADALAFFHQLDTNHDGVIDGMEVANYEESIAPEILPRLGGLHSGEGMDQSLDIGDDRNQDRQHGAHKPSGLAPPTPPREANTEPTQGAALFSLNNQPEPVAAADTQFDGRITPAEFLAAADRRFDLLDTKHQGYLVLSELPKTPVQAAIEKAERKAKKR